MAASSLYGPQSCGYFCVCGADMIQHDSTINYWSEAVRHPANLITGQRSNNVWPLPSPQNTLQHSSQLFYVLKKKSTRSLSLRVEMWPVRWYLRVGQNHSWQERWGLCDIMKGWYRQAKEERLEIFDERLTEFSDRLFDKSSFYKYWTIKSESSFTSTASKWHFLSMWLPWNTSDSDWSEH